MAGIGYLDKIPLRLLARRLSDGAMRPGTYTVRISRRLTTSDTAPEQAVIYGGIYKTGDLSTVEGNRSLEVLVPAVDDDDLNEHDWRVIVDIVYSDGQQPTKETYAAVPVEANRDTGVDLRALLVDPELARKLEVASVPLASLARVDAEGYVLDGAGRRIISATGASSPTTGTGSGSGTGMTGLAVDDDGVLYSTTPTSGTPSTAPTGLAVDDDGVLYSTTA